MPVLRGERVLPNGWTDRVFHPDAYCPVSSAQVNLKASLVLHTLLCQLSSHLDTWVLITHQILACCKAKLMVGGPSLKPTCWTSRISEPVATYELSHVWVDSSCNVTEDLIHFTASLLEPRLSPESLLPIAWCYNFTARLLTFLVFN